MPSPPSRRSHRSPPRRARPAGLGCGSPLRSPGCSPEHCVPALRAPHGAGAGERQPLEAGSARERGAPHFHAAPGTTNHRSPGQDGRPSGSEPGRTGHPAGMPGGVRAVRPELREAALVRQTPEGTRDLDLARPDGVTAAPSGTEASSSSRIRHVQRRADGRVPGGGGPPPAGAVQAAEPFASPAVGPTRSRSPKGVGPLSRHVARVGQW